MTDSASRGETQSGDHLARTLLDWYDRHARVLPWRAPPGQGPADPYHVWLSEIMLQQTTVVAVAPYFHRFLERWPAIEDLAAAPREDVMAAWAGLGYYARARNLHACAQEVAGEMAGRFPDSEEGLKSLPGVGDYTAAAIAAIAFDRPAAVMDGNIERVLARLFAVETPLPPAKKELKAHARALTPDKRPGDYAQAMMDLGATVCLPRNPKCLLCPLRDFCRAHARGIEESLPKKQPKKARPTKYAIAFFMTDPSGSVYLRRRSDKGMLGGMMEVPSTAWRKTPWRGEETKAAKAAPAFLDWQALPGVVRHGFTHFEFEITVWRAVADRAIQEDLSGEGDWVALSKLAAAGLPTVMRKIVDHGLKGAVP